ncbi:phosphoenolpyruvate--protein phosphotransferase [Halocella sp. SP3-1]|uniref:phosphoenolpyruvate--protein phosphotransferase n=1 Tax=Halocella sp. SP3-1 TaxID=2382161 RepID=UPI000F75992C|nr:phosphoenolpyruvate--protein phosphotransferase [Halocella sp. SP3-1]AZO94110.1 phosphoenolpyruvate--protein phosphotransferase [Halocella sp. SP3-1]
MKIYSGKSVFKGIAIGPVKVYKKTVETVSQYNIKNVEGEIQRLETAKKQAVLQLQEMYNKALHDLDEESASIFEVHQMILNDEDYIESIKENIISENINTEYAISKTRDIFAQSFEEMDDKYMKERAADIRNVSDLLIDILQDNSSDLGTFNEKVILLTDDLSPSETLQLDQEKIISFVTQRGSSNSHTAILARMMNIPSLVNTEIPLKMELDGKLGIVDGFNGKIYINPDQETLTQMKNKAKKIAHQKVNQQKLIGKKSITLDGQEISIYGNIGNLSDLDQIIANDCEGIGLFRSEFIYLDKKEYPTEKEQFEIYKSVLKKMNKKKVIIRTLDIGADKKVSYFNLPTEKNPTMGCRAIRICLKQEDVFKTQLRALYRASIYGNLSIMFPMIISLKEIKKIKEIITQVQNKLKEENIKFKQVEIGVMIETPAAVMISHELAREVDFFSIGTNDLTQYTLAIDRENTMLDDLYNPKHKAILRMIKIVADNAHQNNIQVGICGELASDLAMTETFLALGIDELSVVPTFALDLKEKIRKTKVSAVKEKILSKLGI